MKRYSLAAGAAALSILVAACGSSADTVTTPAPRSGGIVISGCLTPSCRALSSFRAEPEGSSGMPVGLGLLVDERVSSQRDTSRMALAFLDGRCENCG